ncbi:hypothetical protein [Rahnella sp. EDr1-12]|uniref:hypothetical protein n=1 Tax=unclassified Rahnella TaxID=2635087 RepID=UPI003BAAC8B4
MNKLLVVLSLLTVSMQANATRYLCIVAMERGHSSFFADTNTAKKDPKGWLFHEVLPNGQYVNYGILKDSGEGGIAFYDSKTKEQIAKGTLSCKPTGK